MPGTSRNDPVYSSLREVRPESNWTTEDTLLHVVVRTTAGLCTLHSTLHSCSLQILHGIVLHEWPVTCLYLSLRWRDDTLVLLVITLHWFNFGSRFIWDLVITGFCYWGQLWCWLSLMRRNLQKSRCSWIYYSNWKHLHMDLNSFKYWIHCQGVRVEEPRQTNARSRFKVKHC